MRNSHSHAAQFAAFALTMSVFAVGLPALAADTVVTPSVSMPSPIDAYYGQAVVSAFRKVGAISFYDNHSLETSAFDIQAFMRDTCFNPTPFDMPGCQYRFGSYADLQKTLNDGTLLRILKQNNVLSGADQTSKVVASAATQVQSSAPSAEGKAVLIDAQRSYQQQLEDRGATLWKECRKLSASTQDRAACYQRNVRVIQRTNLPVEGNIY